MIICEDNDYNPNAESRYEIKGQPPITFENVARIVFYRTDFKSLGLFLSDLFKHRSDKNESVTIQSDLSKENRVPDDAGVTVVVDVTPSYPAPEAPVAPAPVAPCSPVAPVDPDKPVAPSPVAP